MPDRQKRIVLIIGGVFIVFLVIVLLLTRLGKKQATHSVLQTYPANRPVPTLAVKPPTEGNKSLPQILELTFDYDANAQTLSLAGKTQSNGTAHATLDTSLAYELLEVDAQNAIIFDTRFGVTQYLSVDSPYNRHGVQVLPESQTTVSVPYVNNAQTIIVMKNNQKVLVFPIR